MKGKFKTMLNNSAGSFSRRNSTAAAAAAVAAHDAGDTGAAQPGGMASNPLFDDPNRNNPLFDSARGQNVDIQADASGRGIGGGLSAAGRGQNDAQDVSDSYFADESLPVIQPRRPPPSQQLPSLLNQPPLPAPQFGHRPAPLGATRLSIGSSAQQGPPPLAPGRADFDLQLTKSTATWRRTDQEDETKSAAARHCPGMRTQPFPS